LNSIIQLEEGMGKDEQGVTSDRYMLIPRSLIFATRDNQVLLLKGAAHKRLWANRYNGVGGHVEQGEDILSGARREFLEETGLSLINPWLCGIATVDSGEKVGIGIFVFRGECSQGDLVDSREGSLEWVDFDRYPELSLVEDLFILLPRVLAATKENPLFFAQYRYVDDKLEIHFS
jgi:8-oxo-dGTP diphosphatase